MEDEFHSIGSYGIPHPVITYFVDVILSNCPSIYTPLRYQGPIIIEGINDIKNKEIIQDNGKTFILTSFVLSDNPKKRFDNFQSTQNYEPILNFGHWIAFSRINSEQYRFFDASTHKKTETKDKKKEASRRACRGKVNED